MAGRFVWKPYALNKLTNSLEQRLVAVGFQIEGDVKKSFGPGSGVTYKRGNVTHVASAPGEPPAVDTGRLRASISTNWTGSGFYEGATEGAESGDGVGNPGGTINTFLGGGDFKVVVGTNVVYAPFLEYGTSRMAARPYMRPALERYMPTIERLLKQERFRGL